MMARSAGYLPVHNLHNQSKDRVRPSIRSTTVAPGVRTISEWALLLLLLRLDVHAFLLAGRNREILV